MARKITVSELKCACLDPNWRHRWVRGEKPPTRAYGNARTAPVHGALFHQLAEHFVTWLCASKTATLDRSEELWQALYDQYAGRELEKLSHAGKSEAAYRLSLCLKAFCKRLIVLRSRTAGFRMWQDVYLGQEFDIKNLRFDVATGTLLLSGKVDAVRTHPEYGVEAVDYKLSRGTQAKHDLVQLAIYARMLALAKPGLKFHGVLEYYEPELQELGVPQRDLDAIFDEVVAPVLAELTEPGSPQRTTAIKTEPREDRLGKAIRDCFRAFKLEVEVVGKIEAPQLIRYQIRPAPGVKVVSLANRADDLQVRLALPQPPLIASAQGYVTVDIPKSEPDTVQWREVIRDPEYRKDTSPVAIPIGVGIDGRLIRGDFANPNCCHALVAGAAGSGKSEFLKSMVGALIARNTPEELRLSIIDPKVLTFGAIKQAPHLATPVITDVQGAIPCLEQAAEEMQRRYQQLATEQYENLSQRLDAGHRDLPFHVIVFDEFADLILAGKETRERFETLVGRLAAKGRAAGIHLVLTTQRPDRKIVTGIIKANLPLKICLRVTDGSNSSIVLDEPGGEKLLGRGDLLCNRGHGVERAQSPYITQEELNALVKRGMPLTPATTIGRECRPSGDRGGP